MENGVSLIALLSNQGAVTCWNNRCYDGCGQYIVTCGSSCSKNIPDREKNSFKSVLPRHEDCGGVDLEQASQPSKYTSSRSHDGSLTYEAVQISEIPNMTEATATFSKSIMGT